MKEEQHSVSVILINKQGQSFHISVPYLDLLVVPLTDRRPRSTLTSALMLVFVMPYFLLRIEREVLK